MFMSNTSCKHHKAEHSHKSGCIALCLGGAFFLVSLSGCSVLLATEGATSRDVTLLRMGVHRDAIIEEFGLPERRETIEGRRVDYYRFRLGSSALSRFGRAFSYMVANVFTLGAWELIGTEVETNITEENALHLRVSYSRNERVEDVELEKDKTWVSLQQLKQDENHNTNKRPRNVN